MDFAEVLIQCMPYWKEMSLFVGARKKELEDAMGRSDNVYIARIQELTNEHMQRWSRLHCFQMSTLLELFRLAPANSAEPERYFSYFKLTRGGIIVFGLVWISFIFLCLRHWGQMQKRQKLMVY